MKNLILLLALAISFAANAQSTLKTRVNYGMCIKPTQNYKEICMLDLESIGGLNISLVFDEVEFKKAYGHARKFEDDLIVIDLTKTRRITDEDILKEFIYLGKNTVFLASEVNSFKVTRMENSDEMYAFLDKIKGYFSTRVLPDGYQAIEVTSEMINATFKAELKRLEAYKREVWKEFVYSSEEFDSERDDLDYIANHPNEYLDAEELLSINEIFEIYYEGKLIGYYVEVDDYVQAQIYQDGAWYDMFLNVDQMIVKKFDESA